MSLMTAWCISPGGDPSIRMPFPALPSWRQCAKRLRPTRTRVLAREGRRLAEAHLDGLCRMSRRTLARRLKVEGLGFGEIFKQLRSDLITRYLGESTLSISQVAWLVGFRSVAAFSHSCKRSNGMSPKALREKLLEG